MIVLQPQPHRRTMHAQILGIILRFRPDAPSRPPDTGHGGVGRGGFEDLFQVRLFCGRQPDPLHLFHPLLCTPPLVKTSHKDTSKKMQDQPLHVSEDGTFEGEIWGLKTIFYYKNHSIREKLSIQRVIRPLVVALDALDTPGDCAAAPTR